LEEVLAVPIPSSTAQTARNLILASVSPRRKEILEAAGFSFDIVSTSISEAPKKGESARQLVSRLAIEKAEAALAMIRQPRSCYVVGADTVVVIGRRILGKPASPDEARWMLRLLSGKRHRVLTGLCILHHPATSVPARHIQWARKVKIASTTVKFSRLADTEIEEYVATDEPLDKAGAYAIQGTASKYVEWIHGCYFNVVGLPVSLLYRMLKGIERAGEANFQRD
jgi:septum formation protein